MGSGMIMSINHTLLACFCHSSQWRIRWRLFLLLFICSPKLCRTLVTLVAQTPVFPCQLRGARVRELLVGGIRRHSPIFCGESWTNKQTNSPHRTQMWHGTEGERALDGVLRSTVGCNGGMKKQTTGQQRIRNKTIKWPCGQKSTWIEMWTPKDREQKHRNHAFCRIIREARVVTKLGTLVVLDKELRCFANDRYSLLFPWFQGSSFVCT